MSAKRQSSTIRSLLSALLSVILSTPTPNLSGQARSNVIVVTLDGMRWQEIFTGADRSIITSVRGNVADTTSTLGTFWRNDLEARRLALMPFLSGTIAKSGLLLGDSAAGSWFRVANNRRFSYPGYNELFTGAPDDRIDSNRKVPNANVTVLEWLLGRPGFAGSVEVFGSWDVFPFIFNAQRSRLPVNGEGLPFPGSTVPVERSLNQMTEWLPTLWASARLDAPTMAAASVALARRRPRVLAVLLGETDEWAHQRRYDQYLDAARRADSFIEHLWNTAQRLPEYRGRTSLIISTDHGRGSTDADWTDHGEDVPAADRIWMAVLGPGVQPGTSNQRQTGTQSQFAATIATLVDQAWQTARADAARPLVLRP